MTGGEGVDFGDHPRDESFRTILQFLAEFDKTHVIGIFDDYPAKPLVAFKT